MRSARPTMELPPSPVLLIWAALSAGGWCLLALVGWLLWEMAS